MAEHDENNPQQPFEPDKDAGDELDDFLSDFLENHGKGGEEHPPSTSEPQSQPDKDTGDEMGAFLDEELLSSLESQAGEGEEQDIESLLGETPPLPPEQQPPQPPSEPAEPEPIPIEDRPQEFVGGPSEPEAEEELELKPEPKQETLDVFAGLEEPAAETHEEPASPEGEPEPIGPEQLAEPEAEATDEGPERPQPPQAEEGAFDFADTEPEPAADEGFVAAEAVRESPPEPIGEMPETPAAGFTAGGRGKATLKGKCEEIFRGMWAATFYSGRIAARTLLVTSSTRREGTSTIAAGLALSGSGPAGGARVALVDFNLRQPAQHEFFEVRQSPGLIEVVSGKTDLDSAAQRINPNLDLIPSGQVAGGSLDALRNDSVRNFFNRLLDTYDYVLVDCAAANHYPDAQVLGGVLQEVLLVVHADLTPREAVAQAKKRIEAGGGRVVGTVLNKRTFPIPSFLYRRV
jgi:capsular exopolysaccharide synthesis family protein